VFEAVVAAAVDERRFAPEARVGPSGLLGTGGATQRTGHQCTKAEQSDRADDDSEEEQGARRPGDVIPSTENGLKGWPGPALLSTPTTAMIEAISKAIEPMMTSISTPFAW
jgi:hypothetical protein